MPLNFGILQPVNISGQMLAGEQEAMRNQLAQQQLKTGALQQEKSQLELADFKTKQAGLDRFLQVSEANGKTGSPEELANSFLSYAMSQRDPQLIMSAQTLAQAANERKAYITSRMPSAAPSAAPSVAPVAAPSAASMEAPAAAPMSNAINQLAPVNPPVSNALAQPTNTQALEQRILDLQTRFPTAAKTEIAMLTKQLEEARKPHVVGRNLVTGAGQVVFTAPQDITPTDIRRLTTERNALPESDPIRKVYDQAIKDIGASNRDAERRLQLDAQRVGLEGRRVAVLEENLRRDANPEFQQRMAAAKSLGEAIAKGDAAAQQVLPKVISRAEQGIRLIDEMVGKQEVRDKNGKVIQAATKPHAGFSSAVGATFLPGSRFVPGTDASDFMSRFDQVKGASFLEAFESLKGGGSITVEEGKKATDAINRMSTSQSEKEFMAAARDLQDVIRKGVQTAQTRAGRPSGAVPAAGSTNIDALLKKYE